MKGPLQNENSAAGPLFMSNKQNVNEKRPFLWIQGMAKLAHPQKPGLCGKLFNCLPLCGHFFGNAGLKTSVYPFHPVFLQIKRQS